jgi:hypothetical protein
MKKMERKDGRLVLAEGEATGHAHVISAKGASGMTEGEKMFLAVGRAVRVEHEEHGVVTLRKGDYQVGRVQEFDPYEEEVRRVAD